MEGYICRHCVGLLKNFEDHRRKLTDILENIFPLEERLLAQEVQPSSASPPTTPLRSLAAPPTTLQTAHPTCYHYDLLPLHHNYGASS